VAKKGIEKKSASKESGQKHHVKNQKGKTKGKKNWL
jgi:hypothetical protein